MRNAVYLAIVLWFIRRILRKESPAAPVKAPDDTCAVIPTTTPHGIYFALRYLYDNEPLKTTAFRNGQKQEIDRRLATKLPSWKEFI